MRILYSNALAIATDISSPNEDPDAPVERIVQKWKRNVYRATVDNDVITAEWDSPQTVDAFALAYHNLDSCQVRLYDLADNLLATWNITISGHTIEQYEDSVSLVRKAEIEITSPVPIYAGIIFIGSSVYALKEASTPIPYMSSDTPTFSLDYQVSGRPGSRVRGATVTIPGLTADEREEIDAVYQEMGDMEPFFLDLWDLSNSFEPVYGVITGGFDVVHDETGDMISFDFQEVN